MAIPRIVEALALGELSELVRAHIEAT